ncbi:MAG: hypothetical protein ACKODX_03070 [Gemmata sp.]
METTFLVCAVLGGTLLVTQLVATLIGFGGDHVFDHGADASGGDISGGATGVDWFLSVLSVKTATAALTFFGIGGKIALIAELGEAAAVAVAVASGLAALYLVAALMRSLHNLKADGTVRIERSVGLPGTVYLRIPGSRAGVGKVHLNLQNRTIEYQAVTPGLELPTGARVKVVAVVNADTVEVELA